MYGFQKSRREASKFIFSHTHFLQGREDLLPLVKRKIKKEGKEANGEDQSATEYNLLEINRQSSSKTASLENTKPRSEVDTWKASQFPKTE